MLDVKQSSPLIFENKYVNNFYSDGCHKIYYLTDQTNDELLFLYKNSNCDFNNIEDEVKVFSDKEYYDREKSMKNNNVSSSSVLDNLYMYDIGGYPLILRRIKHNFYKITYGSFRSIGKEDDINNAYGNKIRANSVFMGESLKYLFDIFPDIELFDEIADFRISNNSDIDDTDLDFKKRCDFFIRNKFLILDCSNIYSFHYSKYCRTIHKMVKKDNKKSFIYINKDIFNK